MLCNGRLASESLCPRQAFTLIEMLAVLLIMGILTAIAAPRYASTLAGRRVEAAAHRVAKDVARARLRAKVTSASQTLSFAVASNTYSITGLVDPDHATQPYTVSLSEAPYHANITSADLGGDSAITFDGYGVPDSGGTVVVTVGVHQRTVTVDADAGTAIILP